MRRVGRKVSVAKSALTFVNLAGRILADGRGRSVGVDERGGRTRAETAGEALLETQRRDARELLCAGGHGNRGAWSRCAIRRADRKCQAALNKCDGCQRVCQRW